MSLEQDLRNLSKVPIMQVLEEDARRLLAFSGEAKVLRAGDILFSTGEPSDGGYVLTRGSVSLSRGDESSSKSRVILPVSLIGEIALISETTRMATATAREPSAVMKISRSLFHRILHEYPQSAEHLREIISKRLRNFSLELERTRVRAFDTK
jgi:CRP-like cAMP-binding protein